MFLSYVFEGEAALEAEEVVDDPEASLDTLANRATRLFSKSVNRAK
jgi:hypothetical protein